jgi:hypothetical protein
MSFTLVAKKEKRDSNATENYIQHVEKYVPRNTESFYLMGWGDNISFVRKVARAVTDKLSYLELNREKDYVRSFEDGAQVDAICILIRNKQIGNFVEIQSATKAISPSSSKIPPKRV